LPFLLDTGAAVSVLPKAKLEPLLSRPLSTYACPETEESRSITAFRGHTVSVSGSYLFPIDILTRKLVHMFYVIDSPAPFIAGFDLMVAAQLIIYAVGRMVYMRSPSTNTLVSASLSLIVSESTDVHSLDSSVPRDEPSLSTSCVQAALEPSDPPQRLAVDPVASRDDESAPLPSVRPPPDTSDSVSDVMESDVPEHLRVLFLTTVEEVHLSQTLASDSKDLLIRHQDTFAKYATGIGFCNILEHDIDTEDAAPIRQPPRRPPLASGTAEDDLIQEMLAADVIELSDSP